MSENAIPPDLFEQLRTARDRAYAPYSAFRVAAAVTTTSGRCFVGCNVETAHYKSICAEASALSAMIAAGETKVKRVDILATGESPCPPCGDCRQRLREFAGPDAEVVLVGDAGRVIGRHTLGELLPEAFGPDRIAED